MSWVGDPHYRFDRAFRAEVKEGKRPEPTVEEISREYLRHLKVDSYSVLHDENGEMIAVQQTKLGNERYSRKFFSRVRPVMDAFDDFTFDRPIGEGGRDDRFRMGYAFFITLTYDHSLYSQIEAYDRVSHDINLFKAHLERILGPYVCQTVKESTSSAYPAPHLLVITQRPHVIFNHKGTWRLRDYTLYQKLHRTWYDITGSAVSDVEAVVDNSVSSYNPKTGEGCRSSAIRYVFKYITKSLDASEFEDADGSMIVPEDDATRLYTLAMMKYCNLRTILSSKFCAFLGVEKALLDNRLVELCNELKRLKSRKK